MPELLRRSTPEEYLAYERGVEHKNEYIAGRIVAMNPVNRCSDRGAKFQYYQALPSLREYLLVAQDQMLVEHYARGGCVGV